MSRIYFCGPFREMEMEVRRFHPHWSGPTPSDKKNYEPDPKIKNPKAPKKPKRGGKKK